MKKIKVDKVILYYMDRVDPDGNLYRFYVYKDMASEIEYFCTEETGDEQRKTMKLSLSINDDDNDDVFCYCNGIESFKQLAEYGMGEFIVTFCWGFF